ncbi:MAG: PTS sugar transporter subunit IIA [Mycoplasmatales bacterium]
MIVDNLIRLNEEVKDKFAAIELAGQLLVDNGNVSEEYIKSMHERDQNVSVYMGNMIAIPHGTDAGRESVLKTGISIIQIPEGVDFAGNEVKMVFGIAAKGDEHMDIISNIAILCSEEENVQKLIKITDKKEMAKVIANGEF